MSLTYADIYWHVLITYCIARPNSPPSPRTELAQSLWRLQTNRFGELHNAKELWFGETMREGLVFISFYIYIYIYIYIHMFSWLMDGIGWPCFLHAWLSRRMRSCGRSFWNTWTAGMEEIGRDWKNMILGVDSLTRHSQHSTTWRCLMLLLDSSPVNWC